LLALLAELDESRRSVPDLHLLLVAGELPDEATRVELRNAGRAVGRADTDVVAVWAPPGARAMWAQCRGGEGLHTYPDLEWLEVVDAEGRPAASGELLWTAIGWRGTAFFRLQTSLRVSLRDETCPTCQRVGPRVFTSAADALASGEAAATLERPLTLLAPPAPAPPVEVEPTPPPARVAAPSRRSAAVAVAPSVVDDEIDEELDDEAEDEEFAGDELEADEDFVAPALVPVGAVTRSDVVPDELEVLSENAGVAAWQVEYRWVGDDEELLVFLAPAGIDHPGPLCREIDRDLQATQYVVLPREAIEARVARAGLVVDLRG
jgi:hypothetical protein